LGKRRVNIVGIGNPLMGDDGVGPAAIERLGARGVPEGADLWDAGLAVSDVLGMLDPADRLVVIDAVRAGGRPGEVHRLRLDVPDLDAPGARGMLSLHELSIVPALRIEALTGRVFADVTVFGVEPAACQWGEGLSPAVAHALEDVVDEILAYASSERAAAAGGEHGGGTAAAQPRPCSRLGAHGHASVAMPPAPEPAAPEPAAAAAGHVPNLGTLRAEAGDAPP